MYWVESALSEEQKAVLKNKSLNACILASAGSGKTRTLVYLLAMDLASGIAPDEIVAFTFTERAAEELLARIHSLIKSNLPQASLEGMYIGTIHAWCFQYLLTQSEFYNFSAMDELHVDALVSRLYDYLDLESNYERVYPKAIDKFLADLEIYYNESLRIDEIPDKVRPSILKLLEVLHQNKLLTFGGMVKHAIESLQQNGPIRNLRRLYVDEYQDVNPAQVALIQAMVPPECKINVVGDELQCIYNWRGSDVERILAFTTDFANVSKFTLVDNYRSRPPIVTFANDFAKTINLRESTKEMKPHRDDIGYELIHWFSLTNEQEQADTIAYIVKEFANRGIPWNKMAILLRSVIKWGRPIVDTLTERDVPVQCPILAKGGEFINGFLVPLFDWLRVERREPKNAIEETEFEEKAAILWNQLSRWMPATSTEDIFWKGLNHWLDLVDTKQNEAYNVRGCLYDFLDECGIRIAPDEHDLMIGLGIATQIIRSVEEIHRRRLLEQGRRSPRGVVSEVYFELLRKQEEFGESAPINTEANRVLVTTVHQAKGLEWPIVIIPMLAKGCFPVRQRSHESTFPREISKRYGTSTEDERRLFYVAITRAKERLFLLDPAQPSERARSIFLTEQNNASHIVITTKSDIKPNTWKISKEDLRESDPPPRRIGLADLLIYVECPYEFGLRRIVEVQPSIGEELGYGLGLHEIIRRRFDAGVRWQEEVIKGHVDRHVSLPYMSEQGEFTARRAIANDLKKLEDIGAFAAKTESEIKLEVVLSNGVIHGIVDSVQINEDGTILIRDWKSSIHDRFLSRYEKQIQFYAYALRHQGKNVSNAEIVDISESAQQNRIVAHHVDISEHTVERLVDALDEALVGIAASTFSPKPDGVSCGCCDMYRICAVRISHDIHQ